MGILPVPLPFCPKKQDDQHRDLSPLETADISLKGAPHSDRRVRPSHGELARLGTNPFDELSTTKDQN